MFNVNMTGVNTIPDNRYMDTKHERLRAARRHAGYVSARSAAIRHSWSPSTYAAHENGQNDFDWETAVRYAKSFDVNAFYLFVGKDQRGTKKIETIPLAGTISSIDKVVSYWSTNNDAIPIVKAFFPIDVNFVYFEVDDVSLWPKFEEKDLLMLARINYGTTTFHLDPIFHLLDLGDGDLIFRRPEKTDRKSFFDLHTHAAPTIRGARVTRAWPLVATFTRYSWDRSAPSGTP